MSEVQVQAKIKEYLSLHAGEQSLLSLCRNPQRLADLIRHLPSLSPHEVRNLTKSQEQSILQKAVEICPLDLYREVARICPQSRDILTLSTDEVTSRLNLYTTKLILTERPTCDSSSESDYESQKSESFFGQVQLDMRMIEEEHQCEQHLMRNIFEECDNGPIWDNHPYFGLS